MKHSGVLFEKMIRNTDGQIYRYDDSQKTPVTIDVHIDFSGRNNPGLTVWGISHDTLKQSCKNLNRCEISVTAALKTEKVYHTGTIYIDVEHNDQVIDISPLNAKSIVTMKLNPILPNTIIFEYNEKKSKALKFNAK